jgi:peroxiredoxin
VDRAPAVGDTAPDFELANQYGEQIRLSAMQGAPVALVFYPFAFSGVCTGELCELQENLALFADRRVRVLGISADHKYALKAYAAEQGIEFGLLADYWPHGAVAEEYGVFDPSRGFARRATFLLDAQGTVRAVIRSETSKPRALSEYRDAIAALDGGAQG